MKTKLLLSLTLPAASNLFAFVDKDYSGLSDVWEFIYFHGPADPWADSDGDGVNNYDEMIWGTNPTDPTSKVTGPTATLNGANLVFSWPAAPDRIYQLEGSPDLANWQIVSNGSISSYTVALDALGVPGEQFFRLRVTLNDQVTNADGLSAWEEALYVQKFGALPSARDFDGDGMNDLQEFQLGLQPGKKDHPAVGLVVFTPLEK